MPSKPQLTLPHVLPCDYDRRNMLGYMLENRARYRVFGQMITPDYGDITAVWSRLAFAILSANAPFADSVKALDVAIQAKGTPTAAKLERHRMVPAKATFLANLPMSEQVFKYLRDDGEAWDTYRLRLRDTVLGLGLCKASFAACLLYPLESDLACLDTHIQTIYLGTSGFKTLSLRVYREVEAEIRELADLAGVNTFLAQWLLWDYTRGIVSDHNIFPGAHK